LVVVDEEDHSVQLTHYTVQQFRNTDHKVFKSDRSAYGNH
jgi:hypothetical protein